MTILFGCHKEENVLYFLTDYQPLNGGWWIHIFYDNETKDRWINLDEFEMKNLIVIK